MISRRSFFCTLFAPVVAGLAIAKGRPKEMEVLMMGDWVGGIDCHSGSCVITDVDQASATVTLDNVSPMGRPRPVSPPIHAPLYAWGDDRKAYPLRRGVSYSWTPEGLLMTKGAK